MMKKWIYGEAQRYGFIFIVRAWVCVLHQLTNLLRRNLNISVLSITITVTATPLPLRIHELVTYFRVSI